MREVVGKCAFLDHFLPVIRTRPLFERNVCAMRYTIRNFSTRPRHSSSSSSAVVHRVDRRINYCIITSETKRGAREIKCYIVLRLIYDKNEIGRTAIDRNNAIGTGGSATPTAENGPVRRRCKSKKLPARENRTDVRKRQKRAVYDGVSAFLRDQ
jgi:hypothetical protein